MNFSGKTIEWKKKAKPQGERINPEATDAYGCKHKGLLECKVLPSDYLSNYMKEGGRLWNVRCKDCLKGGGIGDNGGTMLDLSRLMPKKGNKDV